MSRMQSREVVHLQWSLRPLPGFGFHGNIICSILRLVLAPLFTPPLKFQSLECDQFPISLDEFLTFSVVLSLFVGFLFLGFREKLQVSVTVSPYLSAAETVCSLSLRVFDSL